MPGDPRDHRAPGGFADGPVTGKTVLVHGRTRRRRLARCAARALGRRDGDRNGAAQQRPRCGRAAVAHAVALDQPRPCRAILAHAPDGVDRIIEVAFSDNVDLDAAVAADDAVIAAYATRDDRPAFPFWPMLFANVTIRLLGSDDFPAAAKREAASDLTTAAREGALSIPTANRCPSTG